MLIICLVGASCNTSKSEIDENDSVPKTDLNTNETEKFDLNSYVTTMTLLSIEAALMQYH